jgi:hypothetical protein
MTPCDWIIDKFVKNRVSFLVSPLVITDVSFPRLFGHVVDIYDHLRIEDG